MEQPTALPTATVAPTVAPTATIAPTATLAPTATATVAPSPTVAPAPTATTRPPTATTRPPTATIAPTRAITPTAARPAATVAPTRPAGTTGGVVVDEDKFCQTTVPRGYSVDSGGDGFDASDEKGFGVLAGAGGRPDTATALAQGVYGNFTSLLTDVQQGKVTNTADSSRIDFTGTLGSNPGQGSVYVKKFGTTACALSVFTYTGAQVPHDTAMTALVGATRENK